MQHVQHGELCWLRAPSAPENVSVPRTQHLVWISTSLGYQEVGWATRSLRLQNPSLTSRSRKHEPGVTPLYTSRICSLDDEAEKHVWRWKRGRCLCCFQHVRSMKKAQELGVAKRLLPSLCTYRASGRARAWWSLTGRTGPFVCQMGTPQFLPNMERMDLGADWTASLCLLWSKQENFHQTPPKEDTGHCWKSPCADGNHTKRHFFLRCLRFPGLFRGSVEKVPVRNKEKCDREEQDPVVLEAVQIQRRHSHCAKSRDYKTLMANFGFLVSYLLVRGGP